MPLGGGSDIVVLLRRNSSSNQSLVDLKSLSELQSLESGSDGSLEIGSMRTVSQLVTDLSTTPYTAIMECCATLGTPSVRNMATIGGNIGRASPASDILPGLLLFDAQARIYGLNGERIARIEDLLTGPGRLNLKPGEFIKSIILPKTDKSEASAYRKVGRVHGADCAVAGAGARISMRNGMIGTCRLALTAVGPTAMRAVNAENYLLGQHPSEKIFRETAEIAAQNDARPITDFRASECYRRELVAALLYRALESSFEKLLAG